MKRIIVVLFVITIYSIKVLSQDIDSVAVTTDSLTLTEIPVDTIKIDSLQLVTDTVVEMKLNNDSSFTIDGIDNKNLGEKSDSIISKDTLHSISTYESVMNILNDSLVFEAPDTINYIIYNLNNYLLRDTIFSDTTKQALHKLMDYLSINNIDPVIRHLKNNITMNLIDSLSSTTDTVLHSIHYLIESIPEDSVKLIFTNTMNDSILLNTIENKKDSVRINLYDNRSEYGTLWIKKTDTLTYSLMLGDGIYLEKTRQQRLVEQRLKSDFTFPKLKKSRKVNIIVPIWNFDGSADVKLNQGYISDSWSEGGESSISALSILKYSADYSYGKLRNFDTDFEYKLGYIQAGEKELKKNDDKFEINAKYGRSAFNNWYYSALLNFKTQLFEGKEYVNDTTVNVISEFLSPAYVVFSLGLDYKPSSKLTVMISPITSKFTIVADTLNYDQTRFGVGKDELIRKEIGAYIKAISKLKFKDYIILENKINFFTNYTNNPQNIDVDWEVDLKVKLTDYISMSVNGHFIYDDDVVFIDEDGRERGARPQFKELFGIGFSYVF